MRHARELLLLPTQVVAQRRTLLEEMAQGMELEVRAAVPTSGSFVNECAHT